MRNYSVGLKAGLAARPNHPGRLLAILPIGLPPVYLNTIGVDYSWSGTTFLGSPGFNYISCRITDASESSLEVDIPLREEGPITPDDVTRGLYVGAAVMMWIFDFEVDEVSPPIGFKWSIGKTTIGSDGRAAFTIRDDARTQREMFLKVVGPGCKTFLGSTRCGVDVLGLWTDSVTIASWIDAVSFTITGARAEAVDGFYDRGAIKLTSGELINRAFTVRSWDQSSNLVKLWEPLPAPLVVGDTALIHAGCNLKRGAGGCLKFDNNRYQGFDHLPADDAKFAYQGTATPPTTVTQTDPPKYTNETWASYGSYNMTGWWG